MQYRTHWRLAFVLAFFFHIVAWLFLMVFVPQVFKALASPPQEDPMEWVELAEDMGMPEEEQEEEPPPPPPPPPEPEQVEEEPAVVEAEVPEEAITEILKEVDRTPEKEEPRVLRSGPGKQIGQPGKILHSEQPPNGVIQFKGRITISAHIGTDGKVMWTKTMVSSGNKLYDRMAGRIVEKQWKFQPATDSHGEAMESDIMCEIAFNVPPTKRYKNVK